jgi:hypothetical protein
MLEQIIFSEYFKLYIIYYDILLKKKEILNKKKRREEFIKKFVILGKRLILENLKQTNKVKKIKCISYKYNDIEKIIIDYFLSFDDLLKEYFSLINDIKFSDFKIIHYNRIINKSRWRIYNRIKYGENKYNYDYTLKDICNDISSLIDDRYFNINIYILTDLTELEISEKYENTAFDVLRFYNQYKEYNPYV